MKKSISLLVAVLILLPGCWGKKKPKAEKKVTKKVAFCPEVEIPLVENDILSYFQEDVDEFVLAEDDILADNELGSVKDATIGEIEEVVADSLDDDFFWVSDIDEEGRTFKTVYFNFDKYDIQEGQEEYVAKNIDLAKELIAEGETPIITVEGHACSSAGSRSYNYAISNNRADVVAQRFIAEGIPHENVKVVARGNDAPTLDEHGNPIAGNREEQWVNRRVEIKVYA